MTEAEAREKIRRDDFLFPEAPMVEEFGTEYLDYLKKEDPTFYCLLRESPSMMPADHLSREEGERQIAEAKKELAERDYNS